MNTRWLLLTLPLLMLVGLTNLVAGEVERKNTMTTCEKQDTRLVQLPSGDWVLPAAIEAIRKHEFYDKAGILVELYVVVIGKSFGHITITVGNNGELQAMADCIATIANTARVDEGKAA